jgi:hypothetical protein
LPNVDIDYSIDCRDAVFNREVGLEALAKEGAYHDVSALWDVALDNGVNPFDDPLERPIIMEAGRMMILLKRKGGQLKGSETNLYFESYS